MINFDDIARENIRKRYPNWVKISDSLYKKLIIGCSESKKQFHLFVNLDIDQIQSYAEDSSETKHQISINKRVSINKSLGLKHY